LLLHGFDDRPQRLWRCLKNILPADAAILAPYGPFPIPHKEEDRLKLRFTWYFYDIFEKTYHIDHQYPSQILRQLICDLKLDNLPCTIVGHSQGGYLAPFAGLHIPQTKRIVGINCEFRHQILPSILPFEIISMHAIDDPIVSFQSAKEHHQVLIQKGNKGSFHATDGGHMVPADLQSSSASTQLIYKQIFQ
jgi:predicted esterase